jgi:hypothetical protein
MKNIRRKDTIQFDDIHINTHNLNIENHKSSYIDSILDDGNVYKCIFSVWRPNSEDVL